MTAIFAQNGSFVHPGHLGLFFNLLSFTYQLFSSQLLNVIQEPTEVNQNTCRPPLTCMLFENKYLCTYKNIFCLLLKDFASIRTSWINFHLYEVKYSIRTFIKIIILVQFLFHQFILCKVYYGMKGNKKKELQLAFTLF